MGIFKRKKKPEFEVTEPVPEVVEPEFPEEIIQDEVPTPIVKETPAERKEYSELNRRLADLESRGVTREEPKEVTRVVKEIPTQPVRQWKDTETGVTYNFITVEEALEKIIE